MSTDLSCVYQEESANDAVPDNTKPAARVSTLSFVKVPAATEQPEVNGDGGNAVELETEEVEEEIVIHVLRPPGTGLGISIAGGVGATPYRGDDEVACLL